MEHVDANPILTIGFSYSEDGFTIAHSGGNTNPTLSTAGTLATNFTGSTALLEGNFGQSVELTRDGGGSFALVSIDLAEAFEGATGAQFQGELFGGGTVNQTFLLDGVFGAQPFTFTGFDNVTKVTWLSSSQSYFQVDNIVVTANNGSVPEPASLGLLGLGLAGLALIRRGARQRRG